MIINEFNQINNKIVNKLKLQEIQSNDTDFNTITTLCDYTTQDRIEFFDNYYLFEHGNEENHLYIAQCKESKKFYIWL